MPGFAQSLFGVALLIALAFALGEGRRERPWPWRLILAGIGIQFALAAVFLWLPPVKAAFLLLNDAVAALGAATRAGTAFVFGYLGGGQLPFVETHAGATFVLAFQALPLILIMSALSALLFYWRVLPWIVRGFAWALEKTLGVGGPVGLAAAANVFVGMVEAPLLVRPYLARLSRADLFVVMTTGMATIAGTVMALYATILGPKLPDALGHILVASILSAPAAILIARLMVPEREPAADGMAEGLPPEVLSPDSSAMEAITRGTADGAKLLINVIAMLIVLVALVSLVNQALGLLPHVAGQAVSLERALGHAMAPVAWAMGVPWAEALEAGRLLGIKTVLNELIAYVEMAKLDDAQLSSRARLIMTYALCGFANFGSLGIMIGGLATLAPERRTEIVALGFKSIVSGTIATCLTGAVVGVVAW